jgi:hypothetical protein
LGEDFIMFTFLRKPWAIVTTIALLLAVSVVGWNAAWAFRDVGGIMLTDSELDQLRGGYAGFYFGVSFTGYWSSPGMASGSLGYSGSIVSEPNYQLPPGSLPAGGTTTGDGVSIQAYVGNFGGASGIFQLIQSPGSYNVIQNNLIVQITMITVQNQAQAQSLQGLLR